MFCRCLDDIKKRHIRFETIEQQDRAWTLTVGMNTHTNMQIPTLSANTSYYAAHGRLAMNYMLRDSNVLRVAVFRRNIAKYASHFGKLNTACFKLRHAACIHLIVVRLQHALARVNSLKTLKSEKY